MLENAGEERREVKEDGFFVGRLVVWGLSVYVERATWELCTRSGFTRPVVGEGLCSFFFFVERGRGWAREEGDLSVVSGLGSRWQSDLRLRGMM